MLLKLLRPGNFSTRPIEGGVSELYKTTINNSDQWLLARGNSKDLPILLMLHGGPGFTDMWLSETCNGELEKHFIVVNWDQRGAGKSFDKKTDPKQLTIEQFVEDGKEVIDHLLEKFNQQKLYLLGQSWGSVLGWKLARAVPNKLHHYIGVGQVSNMLESENRSYTYALEAARKDGNKKAIKELESLEMPAPNDGIDPFKALMKQRNWLAYYGGMMKGAKKLSAISKLLMGAKEYSFSDMLRFNKGMKVSTSHMWHQLLGVRFFEEDLKSEIPITFILGENDHTVDAALSKELFEQINAPSKNMVMLHAAHMPNISSVSAYSDAIKHVLN